MPRKFIIPTVFMSIFLSSLPIAVFGGESDVLINEIMYNPADSNTGGEFVEIYNRGGEAVDVSGWWLEDSAQVMLTLPEGTIIPAGGYLVFYAEEAAVDFYGLNTAISYGPYKGGLSGSGERIALKKVGGSIIDEVTYDDNSPWPTEPDGNGPSLELINPALDNSAGTSWGTGQPYTPGAANNPIIFVPQPHFSCTSGIFTESFSLTLTKTSTTATIYYTLDGSEPTTSSPAYSVPIPISGSILVKAAVNEPGVGWSQTIAEGYSLINSDLQNFTSNLPIVIIDTFGAAISRPEYTLVQATFIDVDPNTGRAAVTGPADHTGMDGIRIRGNSSPYMPKKTYKFETWNNSFQDKDVSLLGLPAESDWALYGPFWDKSLLSNVLAYQWSNEIDRYAPRTRLVEVFLNLDGGDVRMDNLASVPTYSGTEIIYSRTYPYGPDFAYPGDYVGVYVLMEKLTRDKNRVDIQKLQPYENETPEITGGYLIQHEVRAAEDPAMAFSCNMGYWYYEEPGYEEITGPQKSWLAANLNAYKAARDGASFADPNIGYRQYIDVGSFIDHFWLQEMVRNVDAYIVSAFMFKDRLGKWNMGPVWDFDAAFGYMNFMGAENPIGWDYSTRGGDPVADGFGRFRQDPEYELAMWDRWFSLRENVFSNSHILDDIDYYVSYLHEAQARNYQRWPIMGIMIKLEGLGNIYAYPTYQEEVDAVKNFLVTRLNWIDSQFLNTPVLFNRNGGEVDSGFVLTMSLPSGKSGVIYYTLDGSDPRQAYTGAAVGTPYTDPIPLAGTITVKARYLNGSTWSAINEALFIVGSDVVINEFMADNYATIQDPNDPNEFPDWIELYNKGTTAVHLAGKFLTDDLNEPNKFEIPAGVTIDPGEHLLFWADDDGTQGPTHLNFNLSKDGESIGLFDSYANGNLPLSIITFGIQSTDVSYGRFPDGVQNWGFMRSPTPGTTNDAIENLKTCAQIWDEGYGLTEDINADCHIDLQDFASVVSDWLEDNFQQAPQQWDYNAEFSITNGNPNGVWSYGTITRDTGVFQYYLELVESYPNIRWQSTGHSGPDNDGCVTKDMGDGSYHTDWKPGQSWYPYMTGMMTPISDRTRGTGARFTVPATGLYDVQIDFENRVISGYDTYVYVNINSVEVWGDMVTGFESGPENFASYSAAGLSLTAGNTIDFYGFSIYNEPEPYDGGDHLVGVTAIISTQEQYMICGGDNFQYMPADFNQDCHVNLEDMIAIASNWLVTNDPNDPNFQPNW